jgi:hypothetical protein
MRAAGAVPAPVAKNAHHLCENLTLIHMDCETVAMDAF